MRVPVLFISSLIFISCSTTPKSTSLSNSDLILSPSPWFTSIENLKADRCHTQLTDLEDTVTQELSKLNNSQISREQLEYFYLKRMALRQKISDWFNEDQSLSIDCVLLSARIQQILKHSEDKIGIKIYAKKKGWSQEQNVFMHSEHQLLSNSYMDLAPSTSLDDLKNGDIVVVFLGASTLDQKPTKSLSLIRKSENGALESLIPITSSKWIRVPLDHPLSWLKQSILQVSVLRSRTELRAEELIKKALRNISKPHSFENRQPAADLQSAWRTLSGSVWEEPEIDPDLQILFEWKNYIALSQK